MLPFSVDQFFEVFAAYNRAIWPAHVAVYVLACGLLVSVMAKRPWAGRAALILLGVFWIWNGIVYHIAYFASINPAAYGFGGLFVVQGALFFAHAISRPSLELEIRKDVRSTVALCAAAYGLVIYSLIGHALGHGWPRAPMFGVAPCPTAIFTFGVLMLSRSRVPLWLLVIPFAWALIGSTAAVLLGVPEDLGLLAFATVTGIDLRAQRSGRLGG